ncbi:DUF4387 family protein [Pseudomonas mediterranea]|uniref:DUF4387 family protein n=1 Tax=Pseudomonas mediterranea TaxID=183795 RepID=UPI0006D8B02C|nr:DUF4387 family protein [Pseudomonas mediterranea]MBL0844222.1 DUF4387 family protein [Pseudomonas mediterranea]MDU9030299.1 DUF4387 family protein [Pseudomonas mediterranea]CAH0129988.1 hypothetical protein SRABI112_00186 [Pseudomonas mediterranea]
MNTLQALGYEIRSKNAGPFSLTIDVFCKDSTTFAQLAMEPKLQGPAIAELFRRPAESISVFPIEALNVIKISMPRPVVQGALQDRDMHGAQWAFILLDALGADEDDRP